MGEPDAARVDVAALRDVARQYETAADIVDAAVRTHLTGLRSTGRPRAACHVAHGDALRAARRRSGAPLRQWSRAAAEIAADLRSSADRYADADARAARRVG